MWPASLHTMLFFYFNVYVTLNCYVFFTYNNNKKKMLS